MPYRVLTFLMLVMIPIGLACNRKDVIVEQKKSFSADRVSYDFMLHSAETTQKIKLLVDVKFVMESGYRFEVHLLTPKDELRTIEVVQEPGDYKGNAGGGGMATGGSTQYRTDTHLLFDLKAEPGQYRLDVVKIEASPRLYFNAITLQISK